MAEVAAAPLNGFTAVSTFSGCGGSSLGYRMAGFRVAWANEFVDAARDTYRANAPATTLDGRDIRDVTGAEVLDAVGLSSGELDLLDGSPPCAAFSTAGKRQDGWGTVNSYSDTAQRSDDLFFEYARLVGEIQPRVFVAENVSGLVKGSAKGYFKLILRALRAVGYRVEARLLNAAWLGVPQSRQRLFFIGVREDLNLPPVFPQPLPYRYTVREALPWITEQESDPAPKVLVGGSGHFQVHTGARVIHDTSGQFGSGDITDRPSPAITVSVNSVNSHHFQVHAPAAESPLVIRRRHGGAATPEPYDVDAPAPTVMAHGIGGGDDTQAMLILRGAIDGSPDYDEQGRALDPETRQPIGLEGFAIAREWDALRQGASSDRYLNLARNHPDRPSQTITAIGGGVGTAGVTHAIERRKFTLGELRALSSFPPDFILTGTYAQRWERIGRAVPPAMMSHIAAAVRDGILIPLREQ
jgi:DNA (cytosine-5)-methyltransferase 1